MNPFFDLESVSLFTQVVEARSFTSVAEKRGLPKATVSRRIKDLEERIGAQLLLRTTRQVHLTDIGREFLQRAKIILAAMEDSHQLVRKSTGTPNGLLRITAGVEFGLSILTPIILKFQERYPEVQTEVDLTGRYVDLAYEGFDAGIRIGPLPDSSLGCRKLGSFSYGLFAAPEFIKKVKPIRKISDLENLTKLAFSRAGQGQEWKLVKGDQLEVLKVEARLTSNNYWVIEQAALRGHGVVFMPKFLVKESVGRGHLKPILENWRSVEIPIHIVFPQQRFIPSKLRAFIDFTASEISKDNLI
jgi:DNA-binding transcriptional LysR family regulator